ncbi:MAG TPA: hypothetical protein VFJ90_00450 [Candidatus Didemnitutus sp.]|nr:hypothetical protein [Candidatus Didemnitutus sp.]
MIAGLLLLGKTLVATAGLLLPGAGWAHGARWPLPWFAAGVISALTIFAGVVGGAILGCPVTFRMLALWLLTVAISGGIYWWRQRDATERHKFEWQGWWLALPAVPMILVAVWRALLQPLAGADNVFRWDHLARLIAETGRLDFYPAHTAEGFSMYFWADGIAPLVSSLYAWIYLAAGETNETWSAISVLLQLVGLLALLPALAGLWGGPRAGWFAIALGGATLQLQFAFGLGQETGLTALGVGGMALYLMHWQRSGSARYLVPAAACAALAACAREYGAAFLLVGTGWLLANRAGWRRALGFSAGAGLLPAIWHGRNWLLTGNPLYAQSVGGIFPTNPVFDAWMQGYVAIHGKLLLQADGWREIARLLVIGTVPALFGFGTGIFFWRRQPGGAWWILLGILSVVLCVASMPFTAGGFFYSLRVLSPLMVLGCAWGGAVLAQWVPAKRHLPGLMVALVLFGCDAALRAWTIPLNPYSIPPREWPDAGYRLQQDFARDDQAFLENIARTVPGKVLSDSAGLQALFRQHGRQLIPFWSPEVSFLFADNFSGDAVAHLRSLGYSHLLLKRAQYTVDFLKRRGALPRLEGRLHGIAANENYLLFSFDPPASSAHNAAAPGEAH